MTIRAHARELPAIAAWGSDPRRMQVYPRAFVERLDVHVATGSGRTNPTFNAGNLDDLSAFAGCGASRYFERRDTSRDVLDDVPGDTDNVAPSFASRCDWTRQVFFFGRLGGPPQSLATTRRHET